MRKLFTSESVTEGHPDKICDQVSDAVLDSILKEDKNAHVACESICTTGMVLVMGEISTNCYVDIPKLIRKVIADIGYVDGNYGFDAENCAVITTIDEQSGDIAMGVDRDGAGDQGIMFGYACNETKELMPMPVSLAHKLAKKLSEVRKDGTLPYLRPDGKTQVTIEYEGGKPKRVDTVLISTQHAEDVTQEQIKEDLIKYVIKEIIDEKLLDDETKYFVNPTGRFVTGGPKGDSGLTGRKIIVDTYGGYARHGGGAFSGKDPTKVDRSAAYAARYAAKNVVAAGIADRCEIQLAYAIGVAEPVSIMVDTFGTGKIEDDKIADLVAEHFVFTPKGMIETLNLRRPIYRQVAAYGHMGREDIDVPWEKTDKAEELKKAAFK